MDEAMNKLKVYLENHPTFEFEIYQTKLKPNGWVAAISEVSGKHTKAAKNPDILIAIKTLVDML